MPTAALRACPQCGTPGCTVHARTQWQSTHEVSRIRGRKLQRMRMALWEKEPQCRTCGRVLLPTEMVRDHIIPLGEGGQDVEANTQPLCQACSDLKTADESKRGLTRARFPLTR